MSLREIIIVSIMLLTMLLGGYLHFLPQTAVNTGSEPSTATPALGYAKEIASKFEKDTSLSKELFVIRKAEGRWDRDPYMAAGEAPSDSQAMNPVERAAKDDGRQREFVYTGFLQVGEKRLAVINGIEYLPGESIDGQRHFVRRIEPDRVEIGTIGTQAAIVIPLNDFDASGGE